MTVTFEQMRSEAYRLLGDAEDALRDAKRGTVECTVPQNEAVYAARRWIAAAKDLLNYAA